MASADGTYYLEVQGFNDAETGTYELTGLYIDDHGNDAASSSRVTIPFLVGGTLEIEGDAVKPKKEAKK